jgi:predicted nucleotidyltransferase
LLQWLRSPIVYRADGEAMVKFLDLAQEAAGQRPAAHHYLYLCKDRYRRFIERRNRVRLLKYFDVLHPALGLRWLRDNPARPVPAEYGALWAGLDLPAGFSACLEATLLHKTRHRDFGRGPRLVVLDAFIEEEIAHAEGVLPEQDVCAASLRQQADALFRNLVLRSA